jgi:hypothetical protein
MCLVSIPYILSYTLSYDFSGEGLPSKRVIVLDRYTSMKQSKPATNIFQRMMQRQAR